MTVKDYIPQEILALPMDPDQNDAGATSIGNYFSKLLLTLLQEEEGFSGKRPFGNSGWIHDLYEPLVRHGYVDGIVDSEDYVEVHDSDAADKILWDTAKFLTTTDLSTAQIPPKKKDHFLIALAWDDDKKMKIAEAGEILYTEEEAKQQAKTRQQELDKSKTEIIIAVQKIPSEIPNALNF